MSRLKKIVMMLIVILIAVQLIQPARNEDRQVVSTDISKTVFVPANVQTVLQAACYDCHSNHTHYPWYTYVQPVGWILNNHIKNGKRELNFSDFSSYSKRRQESKFKSIASQVHDGAMPLYSYTIMHKNARLTKEEKYLIISWAQHNNDSLDKISP